MNLREALKSGEQYLKDHGITDAAVDAWILLEHVTRINRTVFLAEGRKELDDHKAEDYQELLKKRAAHIPLQHLTGVQEFMGFPFRVNEHVLIPRQDTEILVEEALKYLHPGMSVLDLCTGSGCIAVSLAKLCRGIFVDASDISREALDVAGENRKQLLADVNLIQSDLFEQIHGKYHMILSNPPYIRSEVIGTLQEEVRVHEPYQALDGKEDGLYFYREIIGRCRDYLLPEGRILFEIGCDQGEQVSGLLKEQGFLDVEVKQDLAGLDRVVSGRVS
ncbi:MAG: peptide chain release factor N(5)-glutamine methyltransferase [Lachnospiraceae bacterium]|nr:peptide chain release factor N(5)-glutamine methyltransferase [Lachnospiraceae bacterium]MDD7077068.1 peptide chain release factor N(5)-glutamine methyltransferase [Lachnospiraceae bacterium]MDY3729948.1 peptide chain release factor N(5)-glutamine methyltransferase [Candidatus Choladocola sp.]